MPEPPIVPPEDVASTPEVPRPEPSDEPSGSFHDAQRSAASSGAPAADEAPSYVAPAREAVTTRADAEPEPLASAGISFSELFETSAEPPPRSVQIGQRIRGRIVSIGDSQVMVSYGGRAEGVLAASELRGSDGNLLLRVGDPVSVAVSSTEEPVTFTLGKKRGLQSAARLRLAYESKQAVSGVVRAVNKGGFEVRVSGVRAFCPLSQIDTSFVQDSKTYLGQTYTFRILRWENGGRNIVLSRRAVLKQEAEAKAADTRKRLEVGSEFDGVVTRVQPFGAFVDIGGLEGLLRVSRMGRGHVQDPTHVLTPGQQLRVRVTRLESAGGGKERIALAAADLGPDPWEEAGAALQEGQVVTGRVARLTDFGVFVTLLPGIDGLVHISELSANRVTPETIQETVQPGDEVQVRILRVDRDKKRVSLSIRQAQAPDPAPAARPAREPRGGRPPRDRDRDRDRDRYRDDPSSASSSGGSLTHTMAEQLGALKRKLQVRQ